MLWLREPLSTTTQSRIRTVQKAVGPSAIDRLPFFREPAIKRTLAESGALPEPSLRSFILPRPPSMSEISPSSILDPSSDRTLEVVATDLAATLWKAGVRYPGGAEIWCAFRSGEAAWTNDSLLAASYPSEPVAARLLVEGDGQPFWQADSE
jgi:hypothetical protein